MLGHRFPPRPDLPPLAHASFQTVFAWPDTNEGAAIDTHPSLSTIIANGNSTRRFPSVIRLHPGTYRPAIVRSDALSQTGKITIQSLFPLQNAVEQRVLFSAVSSPWMQLSRVPPPMDDDDDDGNCTEWKVLFLYRISLSISLTRNTRAKQPVQCIEFVDVSFDLRRAGIASLPRHVLFFDPPAHIAERVNTSSRCSILSFASHIVSVYHNFVG